MGLPIILVTILASFGLWANQPSLELTRESIMALLPRELSALSKESNKEEIEKTFVAKTLKKTSEAIHLKYFSRKNDVTIGLKEGKFSYLFVEATEDLQKDTQNLFQKAVASLSEEELKTNARKQKSGTHDSGRYITIELPRLGVKLSFVDNEKKKLHSIIIWTQGEKIP